MKTTMIAIGLIFSASSFASIRTEKTLLSCQTQKWSSVRLLEVSEDSDPVTQGASYYVLQVQHGSRDRASVGAYLESSAPVVFTEHAKRTVLNRDASGDFELIAEFNGTQPFNVSGIRLVGKRVSQDPNDQSLKITLENFHPTIQVAGAIETTATFDFFTDRWNQLISSSDAGVLNDPAAGLICGWETN